MRVNLHVLGVLLCCSMTLLWACGDDDDSSSNTAGDNNNSGTVSSCSACGDQQVCVMTFGAAESVACVPIPTACNGTADCFEQTCLGALYDLCGEDFINTACSDTFPPTVVSCNP